MDQDTVSNGDVDAYWRRRVIALGGVLSAVGVMVWACSGSSGHKHPVSNAAAVLTPSPSPSPSPSRSVSVSVPGNNGNVPLPTVTVTAHVTVTPVAPRRAGDACDPHDVVVSLGPAKETYLKAEHPQFRLSVVNTGKPACTFGVGPKELQIQIASGSDKVWSSAKCVTGTGSSIQLLQHGIPYGGIVNWDRRRSPGQCAGRRPVARPGTYTIAARSSIGIKTKKAVFFLR